MENKELETNKNLVACKSCGNLISKSAKSCPNCGAKNKKPIYKRVWFIILCILVVIGVVGCIAGGGSDDTTPTSDTTDTPAVAEETTEEAIEYTPYNVSELNDDLEENAVNAKDKYKDQYVALTGKLNVIDSDGAYISLTDPNDEWDLVGATCYITDDSQLEKVKGYSKGDTITVKGQITDVGEVLGYYLQIDEIE